MGRVQKNSNSKPYCNYHGPKILRNRLRLVFLDRPLVALRSIGVAFIARIGLKFRGLHGLQENSVSAGSGFIHTMSSRIPCLRACLTCVCICWIASIARFDFVLRFQMACWELPCTLRGARTAAQTVKPPSTAKPKNFNTRASKPQAQNSVCSASGAWSFE